MANIEGISPRPAPPAAPDAPSWITPAEILESIGEAFYAIDRQWRFVYVNATAERLWGRNRHDLLGHVSTEVFPMWVGTASHRAHQKVLETGEAISLKTHLSANGLPVELNIFPRDDGLSVYFRDLSVHNRMEEQLRDRNEILRLAELSAGIGVWDMDMKRRTVRATPQFFKIVGLPPTEDPVPIETLRALRHPADRDEVVNNFRKAMATGQDLYEAEYRIVRPDGEIRWIFGRGRVFRDKDGVPQRYSGVDIDITARKKYEEHLAFTTRELSHRTKNILAVVQAMIRQISQRAKNLPEFEERLYGCISALAHSHDLLVASDWQGADLRGLLELQLTPFGAAEQELDAARFHIDGPDASLAPQAAQLIGLALHELATNAAKHGALSVQKGVVDVTWSDDGKGGINLVWRERGGPKVTPPKATGFGHVVLKRMAASLDATVSLEFPPDGVVWTMPIDAKYLVRA